MKYSVYPMVDYYYRMKVFCNGNQNALMAKSFELKKISFLLERI